MNDPRLDSIGILDALGGEAGCRTLSAAFYARVANDQELRPLFPGKSLRCATEEFAAFLVQFLGGDEAKTQYRWWLSLPESHARFRISEAQRGAWLAQMEVTLRNSKLDEETQSKLLQFFASTSTYVVGGEAGSVEDPELAERWSSALALDNLVSAITDGRDGDVLLQFNAFATRPSVFVGVLVRMLQTGRPLLVQAVAEAVEREPALRVSKYAGRPLLHHACSAGSSEIVALLLEKGVSANLLDDGSHPPLYRLANDCTADSGPEIARMLVKAGADVEGRRHEGHSAAHGSQARECFDGAGSSGMRCLTRGSRYQGVYAS